MDRNKIKDKLKTAKPASWDMIDKSVLMTETNSITYNVDERFIVAIEELSELQQELSKVIVFDSYDSIAVEEEIADVMLALNMIRPINREKFKHIKSVNISFTESGSIDREIIVIMGALAELQQYLSKYIRGNYVMTSIVMTAYDIYDYLFVLVNILHLSRENIEKIISIKIERQIARKSEQKE